MGLDIYAGTLTRYYAQNWKTVTQQWAEANGISFSRVTPDGSADADDTPDAQAVLEDVAAWRDAILRAISPQEGPVYRAWEENNTAPYYTDKPDWDAFGALLLYGACNKYALEVPDTVPKGWDFNKHPVLQRAHGDEAFNWTLYTGAQWWIPLEDKFSFRCGAPNGQEITVGTTGALLAELNRINELGWQAEEGEILSWQRTQGYPADGAIVDGKYQKLAENSQYDTQSLAKFAFSILYQAARFSQANRVPVIMDY